MEMEKEIITDVIKITADVICDDGHVYTLIWDGIECPNITNTVDVKDIEDNHKVFREILFKAKRLDNGEWVEGYCVNVSNKHFYIFTGKLDISNCYLDFEKHSVIPETICQYTGLTDKDGNKIWENDIVNIDAYSYHEPEDSVCGIVRYSNAYSAFCLDCDSENGWFLMYDCTGSYTTIYHVIGSAIDNPELLKGGTV